MCFSASASFTAAGVLGCIGFFASAQVRKKEYSMFAAIPLLFAFQQLAEGVVWVTTARIDYQVLHAIAVYIFLFFALTIWPSWIPISLWLCEENKNRKKILSIMSLLGLFVSAYTLFLLMNYSVHTQVFNCSIWYSIDVMSFVNRELDLFVYTLAAVGPFFISSLPLASLLGGALTVSLVLTYFFMYTTLISVWCFFAALCSIFVCLSLCLRFPKSHS